MSFGRRVLGILGGVVAASAVIAAVEFAGHAVVGGEKLFGVVVLGYGLGALAGTAAATWISDRAAAAAIPVILGVLAAINLFAFPHPGWFAPTAVVSLALGWSTGSRISPRRRDADGRPA